MNELGLLSLILSFIGGETSSLIYAASDFIPASPAGDKSIQFLEMIFGQMGQVLHDPHVRLTPLIGQLFKIFNIAVLSLGSIVISYTMILSTLNTAQEGELMGRKWSSLWIPARCTVGILFLIPTASGYSLIQALMMKFILFGVDAANMMWSAALNSIEPPSILHKKIDSDDLKQTSEKLLEGMLCAQAFNHDPVCREAISHQIVSIHHRGNQLYIGVPDDPRYYNLCGTFTPAAPSVYVDTEAWYGANISALQSAALTCQNAVEEIYQQSNSHSWASWLASWVPSSHRGILGSMTDTLRETLLRLPLVNPDARPVNENKEFGWLLAGAFYFEFTHNKEANLHFEGPSCRLELPDSIGYDAMVKISHYKKSLHDFLKAESQFSFRDVTNAIYNNVFSTSIFSNIWNAISNKITAMTNHILLVFAKGQAIYHSPLALTDGDNDPISNLREWGHLITGTSETLFTTVTFIAFSLIGGACAASSLMGMGLGASLCTAVSGAVSLILPMFFALLAVLWGAGITLGLYIPMIPYLVFTFTALGWFILVIEAMVAAPIVALGLVSPSAEVLGKASPAVMIIASVFLRPSLMVIGFILSITLVKASITMINLGFQAALQAVMPVPESLALVSMASVAEMPVGGLGLFKNIVIICLYTGFVIMIIHECFSLIYVLPDKIIRWIGHSAEQSGQAVKAAVQEIRESTDKGGETAGGLMKGATNYITQRLEEKITECRKITQEIQQGNTPTNQENH